MKIEGFEGTVAVVERDLLLTATGLMLIIIVPVIFLTLFFAWRYRASNSDATYSPDWEKSSKLEVIIWGIPAIMILVLGTMVWKSTHRLDPYRPIQSEMPATRIQAVAYDWKWLFIYPDLGIATVDEMAFPMDRPISFELTSEVALNSFMIPELGGQIYAMAGMETKLNLWADQAGTFQGRNMQYTGDGFSEQTFDALSMDAEDFETWVTKVRAAPQGFTGTSREALKKPTTSGPVMYFNSVEPDLFETILSSYAGCHGDKDGICQ